MASISTRVPDRFIASTLARTLQLETGLSALAVRFQMNPAKVSLQDWATLHGSVDGEFAFERLLDFRDGGTAVLSLQVSADPGEADSIRSLVSHISRHFHYVLLQVPAELPVPVLMRCLAHSGRAFLLLRPTAEDFYHRDLLLREVRGQRDLEATALRSVVCRESGEERSNELLRELGSTVHDYIHGCPVPAIAAELTVWADRHFQSDIRRLAREIARRRVGVALSAGGARGLAHIGVFQVLEENGIEIDVVAGCSMGAYVGAVWAYGYDGLVMERLAREVEHRWGLLELIDPFILPRQGFLRGEKVKRRLKRSIGEVHFAELARPLQVVATNLCTLERVVFSSGEVAAAVHASAAIPGACAPVKLGEDLYVDGGIADPMPVDVLEELGIERIIAVNTIPTPAYLRCRLEMDQEQAQMHGRRPGRLRALLNQYLNYFAPGNILDTILRSIHGAQMRVAEESCLHADLILRPLSFDGRWHDFRHPGKYIALGRREAEEHLEEVKSLVNHKESGHELEPVENALATIA